MAGDAASIMAQKSATEVLEATQEMGQSMVHFGPVLMGMGEVFGRRLAELGEEADLEDDAPESVVNIALVTAMCLHNLKMAIGQACALQAVMLHDGLYLDGDDLEPLRGFLRFIGFDDPDETIESLVREGGNIWPPPAY